MSIENIKSGLTGRELVLFHEAVESGPLLCTVGEFQRININA